MQNLAAAGHADIREYSAGFRVVGCTEATDARDNTRTIHTTSDQGVAIYWLGGNRLADDYGDFYDGSWDEERNNRDRDESGANGPDTSQSANFPFTGCEARRDRGFRRGGFPGPGQKSSVRVGHPQLDSGDGPISGCQHPPVAATPARCTGSRSSSG